MVERLEGSKPSPARALSQHKSKLELQNKSRDKAANHQTSVSGVVESSKVSLPAQALNTRQQSSSPALDLSTLEQNKLKIMERFQ